MTLPADPGALGLVVALVTAGPAILASGTQLTRRRRLTHSIDSTLDLLERVPESAAKRRLERAMLGKVELLADEVGRPAGLTNAHLFLISGPWFLFFGFISPELIDGDDPDWWRRTFIILALGGMAAGFVLTFIGAFILLMRWIYDRQPQRTRDKTSSFTKRLIGRSAEPTGRSAVESSRQANQPGAARCGAIPPVGVAPAAKDEGRAVILLLSPCRSHAKDAVGRILRKAVAAHAHVRGRRTSEKGPSGGDRGSDGL